MTNRKAKIIDDSFTEADISISGAVEKVPSAGALTIGFTDADPVIIYTNLGAAITSLTFTTSGAVVSKKIVWYVKGNYAIAFGTYIKAGSSMDYGGVHARIDLECGVNPSDGTVQFWYNIINIA